MAAAPVFAQGPNIVDLQRQAEAGNAEAQFKLAQAYYSGDGVMKDSKQGLEWLRKSARQGYAGAEVTLGYMYQVGLTGRDGVEVARDPHEAASWYRKAAKQQNKNARAHLSEMLAQGLISKQEAEWQTPEPAKEAEKAKSAPFSITEIETGLAGGITNKRMATLVNTYGVDFSLSAAARKRLADEGADDNLLATISSSRRSF